MDYLSVDCANRENSWAIGIDLSKDGKVRTFMESTRIYTNRISVFKPYEIYRLIKVRS